MHCPHCVEELKITERQGIEIDYCPVCRGVWLDRGELDKIIERSIEVRKSGAFQVPQGLSDTDRPKDRDYGKKKKKKKYKSLLEDIFDF